MKTIRATTWLLAATCDLASAQATLQRLERTVAPHPVIANQLRSPSSDSLVDLDGDGDLDYVSMVGVAGPRINLFVGSNSFGPAVEPNVSSHCQFGGLGFAIGDVDGDGVPDMLKTNYPPGPTCFPVLLLGDGSGGFLDVTASNLLGLPVGGFFWACTFVDVDSDQDLDAILCAVASNQDHRVLINNGSGVLSDDANRAFSFFHVASIVDCHPLDIDDDGDQDLLFAMRGDAQQRSTIMLNDGAGVFSLGTPLPSNISANSIVKVGDVDSDGDPDLMMFGDGWPGLDFSGPEPHLLLNDGAGSFSLGTYQRLPAHNEEQHGALADFDGDGDLDVVSRYFLPVASSTIPGEYDVWAQWVNDGTGHFSAASSGLLPRTSDPLYVAGPVFAGDIDDDGDIDVVTGFDSVFAPQASSVLWNMRRQLHVPVAAHLNGSLDVDVWADHGHLVSLLVAFHGNVRYDLGAWGSLRLDPGRLIMTAPRSIPPSRLTSYHFPISSDPVFLGLDVHLQAIDGHPSDLSQLHLTGVWIETILP